MLIEWDVTESNTVKTTEERKRLLLRLRHNHLPRLTAAGLITYDNEKEILRGKQLEPRVREILQWSLEEADKRS